MRLAAREVLWLPIMLGAVLGVYLFGIDNPLVFDDELLASGSLFAQYGQWDEIKPRLLSYTSFVWIRDLFGDGWWKQRLANLTLHVAVVLALWGFYRDILKLIAPMGMADPSAREAGSEYFRSPALGLAVTCFALNPVAVYAVAYLIQRSILMATLFTVLGLWAFMRGFTSGRRVYFGLALLCYILAVASKEHAMMAPLAAVSLYILAARPPGRRLALIAGLGVGLVSVVALLLMHRYDEIIGQPFDLYSRIYLNQLARLGPDVEGHAYLLSIINQAYLFFSYGLRWVLPATEWMSIDIRPPFPVALVSFPQILGIVGYLAVLLGSLWLVLRYRDWRALVGLSLFLPAVLFMTEFITVWVQDPFVLYRSYLWAIGLPGLVFFLFHGVPTRILLPTGLLIGGLFVWQSLDRVYSLSSKERVWTDAIAKLPDDHRSVGRWFPYLNRGNIYLDQDRMKDAIRDFRSSSDLGDGGMGLYNIGALLFSAGRYAESLESLDQAHSLGYDLPGLYYQQGSALLALGRRAEARKKFDEALAKAPASPEREEILSGRGRALLEMGEADAAIADLMAVLATKPDHEGANLTLGMARVVKGEFEQARDLYTRLLNKDKYPSLYYGRAMANFGLKLKRESLSDIDNAILLDPRNPALRTWREKILAMPGA